MHLIPTRLLILIVLCQIVHSLTVEQTSEINAAAIRKQEAEEVEDMAKKARHEAEVETQRIAETSTLVILEANRKAHEAVLELEQAKVQAEAQAKGLIQEATRLKNEAVVQTHEAEVAKGKAEEAKKRNTQEATRSILQAKRKENEETRKAIAAEEAMLKAKEESRQHLADEEAFLKPEEDKLIAANRDTTSDKEDDGDQSSRTSTLIYLGVGSVLVVAIAKAYAYNVAKGRAISDTTSHHEIIHRD